MNVQKVIWVQELTLFNLAVFLFYSIFDNIEIRFDEKKLSIFIKIIINFLNKFNSLRIFFPATFAYKDQNSYSLEYERSNKVFDILEDFCNSSIDCEPVWFKYMTKCFLASYLDKPTEFITMIENPILQMKDYKHEIYIKSSFANHILINFFKTKGIIVKEFFPFKSYFLLMAKPLYLIIKTLINQRSSKSILGNIQDILSPSVWLEYEGSNDLIGRNFINVNTGNKKYKYVYYLDRADTPVTREITSLNQSNVNWIDLHNLKHSFLTLKDLIDIISYPIFKQTCKTFWFIFFLLYYKTLYCLYKNVFNRFNVKVLIQHRDTYWIQEPQSQAIKDTGGIMLGFHWSNYFGYNSSSHINSEHVFFTWGKAHYELLQKKGHTCNYILPGGLWLGNDNNNLSIDFPKEVDFLISIFDSSAVNIFQTSESLSQFYFFIIELLETNPNIGAIFKPKFQKIDDLVSLPEGQEIILRLKSLINQKRAFMLDFTVSPVTAAINSDLSVCFGINSAGVVASLHGGNAIHWDCSGFLDYPIYRDKEQKIIFQSLDDIKSAILSYSKGDKSIGDFSKWRKVINYFDDTSGAERIVDFIDMFMEEINKTVDRDKALEISVKRYKEKYNVSDDFYRTGEFW